MSHITKQNFITLIITGISKGDTPREIRINILSKAEELGLETNTEGFANFAQELTEDYIVPLRNAVAGKLTLSQLSGTLEMLLSTAIINEKELIQKLSSYAKNQNLSLDEAIMNELIALQQFAHPTLLTEFFPAFLDFDLSVVENTTRKKSNAIISLAKNFGLKINSSIAKDLLILKDLFEKNQHFPALKEIIKNLLSANISEADLKAVLTNEARLMGYDFQDNHIEQLVQLKKDYALLLNGPEATPGKNIITTAMFASAMLYQFPGMVSHMLAFQTINTGLKKVIGTKLASWLPLTGLFASMIGYPLPHSTYINMLNNFIYGMIQEHPTAAFLVLVPASVLYYRFDDVRALYHKGKAFASDPFGFEEMFSDAFGEAFSSFASQTSVSESVPQILVFPRRAAITAPNTEAALGPRGDKDNKQHGTLLQNFPGVKTVYQHDTIGQVDPTLPAAVPSLNKIQPFTVEFGKDKDQKADNQRQANEIIAEFERRFNADPNAKVAITYSANNDQAEDIIKGYTTGKYSISGSNQAAVIRIVIEEIKKRDWQDKAHILPVATSQHSGGSGVIRMDQVNRDLANIAQHLGAGWQVLGFKNQATALGTYAVGGGVSAKIWKGKFKERFDAQMKKMTEGDFSDPVLQQAYQEGQQKGVSLMVPLPFEVVQYYRTLR